MFKVAYKTDVGKKRDNNQDAIKVREDEKLYIVADGMGGHQAGEVASSITVETIEEFLVNIERFSEPQAWIEAAIKEANKRVYLKSLEGSEFRGMGTTCSLVYCIEDQLHIGHVGDSRIYVIDENIEQITADHTLVEDLVLVGEITKAEAKVHPKRHVITRAIGTDPVVDVDYNQYSMSGVQKVLLCSDGLTEKVNDQEILTIINTHTIEEAVNQLVQLANDRGGSDNISVILLDKYEC